MSVDVTELTEEDIYELDDDEFDKAYREASKLSAQEEVEPTNDDVDSTQEETAVEDVEPSNDDDEEPTEENDGSIDEVDDSNQETQEQTDGKPDEEPKVSKGDTKDQASETHTELKPVKIDGVEVPVKSMEELYALASAGGKFTKKMQEIAKYKKSLVMMDEQGISEQDLSLLAEIKGGSKDALAVLLKQAKIDPLDIDETPSENYVPGAYIPNDQQVTLMEIDRELSVDPEYNITRDYVNNQLDPRSQDMLIQNPNMIRGLHQDIKSGVFPQVQAVAQKLRLMDGGTRSDMEYYIAAANEPEIAGYQEQTNNASIPNGSQPQQPQKRVVDKNKKRSAGSSNANKTPSKPNVWEDMSDEELMAYREQVLSRV